MLRSFILMVNLSVVYVTVNSTELKVDPDVLQQNPEKPQCGLSHTMAWAECMPFLAEPCPTTCSNPDDCQFPYCDSMRMCKCENVWCKNDLMCYFFRIPCSGNFTCRDNSCICQ